jgi:excinuclease ABC subunit B
MDFKIHSKFQPAGDQPQAIQALTKGLQQQVGHQTLLGVTGSGKTFTMANVIAQHKRPALILSHNKSLAAQLYEEFKTFFPENKVGFFISYYDYYQPESYMAQTDTYIEKDVQINEKIEQMRMQALSDLLTHDDVIIISSISCIYGLGDPKAFREYSFELNVGQKIDRQQLIEQLIAIQYERNDTDLRPGKFRVRGDIVDIILGGGRAVIRVEFFGDEIDKITIRHTITMALLEDVKEVTIFPATAYVYSGVTKDEAMSSIRAEMESYLPKLGPIEAHRLKQRTNYDLEMIEQLGYCKGIENYSRHFEGRTIGEPASTLLDFFPEDFLFFIDESHVTLPQVHGMFKGDRSRKTSLIENGFRLPSAYDNRPLQYHEFEKFLKNTVYVSATPGEYELEQSAQIVEQIIRPTGLVDPPITVLPTEGQIDVIKNKIREVIENDGRILLTTLTKRMSEELNDYLLEQGIRSHYLHSEIDTLERIQIIKDLRQGKFDVLIGINLLREGLDIPEVQLVAILDADKQGFLRTERSLIQTIGRAARNSESEVLMFGDTMTPAMEKAIQETERRRKIQMAYNEKHGITPQTIVKSIKLSTEEMQKSAGDTRGKKRTGYSLTEDLLRLQAEMEAAAHRLDFEKAIELRERIKKIEAQK